MRWGGRGDAYALSGFATLVQEDAGRPAERDLLPADVLERKKMGFGAPLDHWFRKDLRPMACDLLLSGAGATHGLFNLDVVRRMVDEQAAGTAQWHDQLWNLLILEHWFRTFIDRRPGLERGSLQ